MKKVRFRFIKHGAVYVLQYKWLFFWYTKYKMDGMDHYSYVEFKSEEEGIQWVKDTCAYNPIHTSFYKYPTIEIN